MNPYIFEISTIWGMFKYMYMTTPISALMSGQKRPKKAKNGTLTRQILGVTDLKHGMHAQLNFGSNMGRIQPGSASSHWCVKRKSATKKNF